MTQVFLGGTCNGSKWRELLIPMLDPPKISYFNPVVEDWNEEARQEEIRQRRDCDFCLYVLTPRMAGTYAVAEVVDDSNKRPEKTILAVLAADAPGWPKPPDDFDFRDTSHLKLMHWSKKQAFSLEQVKALVKRNGATVCDDLQSVAVFLNGS